MAANADIPSSADIAPYPNAAAERPLPTSGILPQIQNIVATCTLGCRLGLTHLAQHVRNAEYAPNRFAAVVVRIREPRTTALIFATGRMVITGAKSEDDAKLAARKNARIIQKQGYCVKFQEFRIQNIVGSGAIGGEREGIELNKLARDHREFASYESERFPGLCYSMYDPKVVLLMFYKGKIVITGARTREEVYEAWEKILPVVKQYPFTVPEVLLTQTSKQKMTTFTTHLWALRITYKEPGLFSGSGIEGRDFLATAEFNGSYKAYDE